MKKFVIGILLCCALLFSGCSCSGESYLEFSSAWGGKTTGYTETLVYDVKLEENYNKDGKSFVKDADLQELTSNVFGEYTVTTSILPKLSNELPNEVKTSAVYEGTPSSVVSIKTVLSLSATYTLNGKTETSTDRIVSETYFCSFDYALAPIYSKSEFDYGVIKVTDELILERLIGCNTVLYGGSSYKTATKTKNPAEEEYTVINENELKYTPKTLIDSSQLLFVIRNLSLDLDGTKVIPTVHPTYSESKSLSITHYCDTQRTVNVNGQDLVFKASGVSYKINSMEASGYNQLVFVQSAEAGDIPNNALILSYVEPIVEYNAYKFLGAMEYTLKSASFSA